MESVDTIVIGAGVVGLAVGRALAIRGRDLVVIEKNAHIGEETSSRNSEVIHAGIYYPTGSFKARFCVEGKQQLYAYAESMQIRHRRIGKLIVAIDDEQIARLRSIANQARINGVLDLEWLDAEDLRKREPNVRGAAALWSPSTGIIDAHGLMLALQADIEAAGGVVARHTELIGARTTAEGIELGVRSGGLETFVTARNVINAAGLHAHKVGGLMIGIGEPRIPELHYARGNYFLYTGQSPFEHLVYPIPIVGGLGIHATLDLAGALRFGPDVEWIDELDYTVDASRAAEFYAAIRQYWPALPDGSLRPGYAGIRPKLTGPNEPAADFEFIPVRAENDARVIHLLGIESPGLTSCLAIADYVLDLLS